MNTMYVTITTPNIRCMDYKGAPAWERKSIDIKLKAKLQSVMDTYPSKYFSQPAVNSAASAIEAIDQVSAAVASDIQSTLKNPVIAGEGFWTTTSDGGHEGCGVIVPGDDGWGKNQPSSVTVNGMAYLGELYIDFATSVAIS